MKIDIETKAPVIKLLNDCVFDAFGITIDDLRKKDKTRYVSLCRIAYTNVAYINAKILTVIELGLLTNRTHSNVSWQLKKHNQLIKTNYDYIELYTRLNNKLNQLKTKENGMV